LRRTVEEAGDHKEGCTEDRVRDDPENGAQQTAVAATGDAEEHEMECADHEIGDAEDHPSPKERGAARDTMSIAATAASMTRRTAPSSGRMFVSHAYADHTPEHPEEQHGPKQTAHVGLRERKLVTCVMRRRTRDRRRARAV
jgi:hypothetical protein